MLDGYAVTVLGDELADANVVGFVVTPVAVENLESASTEVGFGVSFDLCACSFIARALGGVDELGRVGAGDVDEIRAYFVVVLEFDQGCRLIEGQLVCLGSRQK